LRAKNWKEYTATVEDIERFLSDHVLLRNNVVTGRTECRVLESDLFADWIAEGLPTDRWLPVSDRIVNTLWRGLSKTKKLNVRTQDIHQIIRSDFLRLRGHLFSGVCALPAGLPFLVLTR